MSSNYNSRPRAPEVLVDRSTAHLVRRRESVDELFAHDAFRHDNRRFMTASSRRRVFALAVVVAVGAAVGLGSYLIVADGRTAKSAKEGGKGKGKAAPRFR